jgi:hypothetical protein
VYGTYVWSVETSHLPWLTIRRAMNDAAIAHHIAF